MIYGDPQIRIEDDGTDRIGIRTVILSLLWQPSRWPLSLEELDGEKPNVPAVPGGVEFIGEQTKPLKGGLRTFWTFEGIAGDGKTVTFKDRTNSPDYSFEPGFSQVSIVKQKNWAVLKSTWGGAVQDGQVIFPDTVPSGGSSGGPVKDDSAGKTNPMFGQVDFFRMEGTYSFRYASASRPSRSGLGKIASGLPGNPPVFANRNWLFAAMPWQRRGPVYDVTEVYWLSGEGGWPPQIYTDDPTAGSGGGSSGNQLSAPDTSIIGTGGFAGFNG